MSGAENRGPVLIDLEDTTPLSPAEAAPLIGATGLCCLTCGMGLRHSTPCTLPDPWGDRHGSCGWSDACVTWSGPA